MQVYKLIIHMLFGVIFYSTKIYSQVTIDYTNSRINTLSKFSSGGSIILGTESKDTIADTLIKSYASSYEATSSKTTCSINKINNTLRIRFDILNKHNGMRGSDSKTTIHLPLLLHSQCKYLLSGNYQTTGKNKVTFETILHTNIDTLFKNIQLSINQISPFFELDTVIADSIQCMGGNISGVLNVEQDAILDINIGIYGINATSIAAEGSGYIDIFLDFSTSTCKPNETFISKCNNSDNKSIYYYNIQGKRINSSDIYKFPNGIYFFGKQQIINIK